MCLLVQLLDEGCSDTTPSVSGTVPYCGVGQIAVVQWMTCVHGYDVIGVRGDMDMFPLSAFTSVSWVGVLRVHLEFRKVLSLVLRARFLVEGCLVC